MVYITYNLFPFNLIFVPGGVLMLTPRHSESSTAWQVMRPSVREIFNILGAAPLSSFTLGAATFLIFVTIKTTLPVMDSTLPRLMSSGMQELPISLKSILRAWKDYDEWKWKVNELFVYLLDNILNSWVSKSLTTEINSFLWQMPASWLQLWLNWHNVS